MSPPAAESPITGEQLQKELLRFAREALRTELTQLRGEVRADLREELQPLLCSPFPAGEPPRLLDEGGQAPSCLAIPGTVPPELKQEITPSTPASRSNSRAETKPSTPVSRSNSRAEIKPSTPGSRSNSKRSGGARSGSRGKSGALRKIADVSTDSGATASTAAPASVVEAEDSTRSGDTRASVGATTTDRISMSPAEQSSLRPPRAAAVVEPGKGNAVVRNAWVEPTTSTLPDSDEFFDMPLRASRITSKTSLTKKTVYARLSTFVTGPQFDYLSGALVILNAAVMGIQTDWQARNVTNDTTIAFRGLELTFCILFTVELLLRVLVHGRNFFARKHAFWHAFDSFLVVSQLFEEGMVLIVEAGIVASSSKGSNMTSNFSILRIMRILRLIRVMRLVRILRLIGELRTLVMSILGSLRSLIWAVVLLFMMMYVMGVYLTQLVLDTRIDSGQSDQSLEDLVKYYGSLGDTILSVYMAVTGGVDWGDILDPLKNKISGWLAPFFMFYIAFALLCMLNVITGVFVESALLTAKKDKDSYLVHSVRCLFNEHDADNNGTINEYEFMVAIESQEMQSILTQLDMRVADASALFQVLDLDQSGSITVEEFIAGCTQLSGHAKALELAILVRENDRQNRLFQNHAHRVEAYLEWIAKRWERAIYAGSGLPAKNVDYARPVATPPTMHFMPFDLAGEEV